MRLRARTEIARRLRREATDVEKILWRALRERVVPWKFRRQHPIGRRIADFACPARKLVIELDGGQHAERMDADDRRSAELILHGYRVIRFWNNDVLDNLDGVLETIRCELEAPPATRPTASRSAPLGFDRKAIERVAHPTSPPPGAERGRFARRRRGTASGELELSRSTGDFTTRRMA
jgi:very-short-patch-repair endonuclease